MGPEDHHSCRIGRPRHYSARSRPSSSDDMHKNHFRLSAIALDDSRPLATGRDDCTPGKGGAYNIGKWRHGRHATIAMSRAYS